MQSPAQTRRRRVARAQLAGAALCFGLTAILAASLGVAFVLGQGHLGRGFGMGFGRGELAALGQRRHRNQP